MVNTGAHREGNSGQETSPKDIGWAEALESTSGEDVMIQCSVPHPSFPHPAALFILPGLQEHAIDVTL